MADALWEALNSPLVLFFLGSVVATGLATYWAWRQDKQRQAQDTIASHPRSAFEPTFGSGADAGIGLVLSVA